MICARCDKRIKGKPRIWQVEGGSAGGATVTVCPAPCKPVQPRQTTPRGLGR